VRDALVGQVTRTVRWTDCMDTVLAAGCRHMLELGPGRSLTALARQNSRLAIAMAADCPEKLLHFAERYALSFAGSDPGQRTLAA
jgi:malonyl CoA-acyl carrier protein transacylase